MEKQAVLLFTSPWQKLRFFDGFTSKQISELLENAEIKKTKNREFIFKQDENADSFIFVIEGLYRLFRINPKGHRSVMDIVGPGGMVGGLLMAQPGLVYPISCQSIRSGTVLKIPQATYLKAWTQNSEVIIRTQKANLERMQTFHGIRELQKYSLEEKVIQLLKRLAPVPGSDFELKVMKTDLADMVGSSIESMIRLFSGWEKKHLVYNDKVTGSLVISGTLLSGAK